MSVKRGRISQEPSKFERLIDKSIIYMIITLIILLLFELFVDMSDKQLFAMELITLLIIIVFAIDLYYIYQRSPDWKHFLRHYWSDIIAIIPIAIISRIIMTATGGGGLPYATVTGLFKMVRIERFLSVERLKRLFKIAEVSKKIRVSKTIRTVKAYDKVRLGGAKTMTRARKKGK